MKQGKSPNSTVRKGNSTSDSFNKNIKDSLKQFAKDMKKLEPICEKAQKEYERMKTLEATMKNMETAYENLCEKEKEIKQISENLEK